MGVAGNAGVGKFRSICLYGDVWLMPVVGVPVNGTAGTGAGKAGPGSVAFNTLTGNFHANAGTQASPLWVAAGGQGVAAAASIALTAAQITTLHSVPVPLIAAPGAGFALAVKSLVFEFVYGTVQFTGGGAVQLQYHGASANLLSSTVAAAAITAAANATQHFIPAATASGIVVVANAALELAAASADFAAGDSTAKAHIEYRVITL